MHQNTTIIPTLPAVGYFDGYWFEDELTIACRVVDRADGRVSIAATSIPGTDLQDCGYGIAWARDDEGRVHYAVTDGCAWPDYAATVEEAWEKAVQWARRVDPEYPFDISFDRSVPALGYGDKEALLAGIPTN